MEPFWKAEAPVSLTPCHYMAMLSNASVEDCSLRSSGSSVSEALGPGFIAMWWPSAVLTTHSCASCPSSSFCAPRLLHFSPQGVK